MMDTTITCVDGADGLTPDMLRGPNVKWEPFAGVVICYRKDVPEGQWYGITRKHMVMSSSHNSQG